MADALLLSTFDFCPSIWIQGPPSFVNTKHTIPGSLGASIERQPGGNGRKPAPFAGVDLPQLVLDPNGIHREDSLTSQTAIHWPPADSISPVSTAPDSFNSSTLW